MQPGDPLVVERTDVGRVRDHNEDFVAHRIDDLPDGTRETLLVCCDGMGGHAAGEVASEIAARSILGRYFSRNAEDSIEALTAAIVSANAAILEAGRNDVAMHGMGSTCVAAGLRGYDLVVAHVGDCRAYIVGESEIERITEDHSWVAEQVRAGLINEQQAHESAYRSVITRALGLGSNVLPDLTTRELTPGQAVLLCSDGLWDLVDDPTIASVVRDSADFEIAADRLIALANERGAPDNVSVILARPVPQNVGPQSRTNDLTFPSLEQTLGDAGDNAN